MNEIDEIRQQMALIRRELHEDVTGVVDSAGKAFDWLLYVRNHPWLSIGVAFGIGYLLVRRPTPSKPLALPPTSRPGERESQALLTSVEPDVPARPRRSWSIWSPLRWSWELLGPVALHAAQAYASKWVEESLLGLQPVGPPPESVEEPYPRIRSAELGRHGRA